MLALQVITAIRTKPAKLLLVPFLFVLKVLFQALSVPPLRPPPSLPCVRQAEAKRSRRLLGRQQNAGLNSLADFGCEIHGGRSIGAPEPTGMSSGGCFKPEKSLRAPLGTAAGAGAAGGLLSPSRPSIWAGPWQPPLPHHVSPGAQSRPLHTRQTPLRAPLASGASGGGCSGSPMALPNLLLRGQSIALISVANSGGGKCQQTQLCSQGQPPTPQSPAPPAP